MRSFEEQYEKCAVYMDLDPSTGPTIPFDCTDPNFLNAYFKVLHKPYERARGLILFWWIDWQQGSKSKIPGLDPLWASQSLSHFR